MISDCLPHPPVPLPITNFRGPYPTASTMLGPYHTASLNNEWRTIMTKQCLGIPLPRASTIDNRQISLPKFPIFFFFFFFFKRKIT